ncbi:MAG: PhoH family protein [Firmicutes bacterium]|nr:PhoH family protein [Bacillota bacterium]
MGNQDKNLEIFINNFGIRANVRDEGLVLSGPKEQCEQAKELVVQILEIIRSGHSPTYDEIAYMVKNYRRSPADYRQFYRDVIITTPRGKKIYAKTMGQYRYIKAIQKNEMVFGIGPAGTGKTYLGVAMAVRALKEKQISKIILTRPAIEAGERLGFLPGDLQDKVDPYLRPLYDALLEFLGLDVYQKFMEKGIIEVAPLAYMRGRTLNDAFIILDEAQNTTPEQMKMFLTRFGFGSKAIITGDITQIDLPGDKVSGLRQVVGILSGIDGIGVINLDQADVVRHRLVGEIVRAYAEYAEKMR